MDQFDYNRQRFRDKGPFEGGVPTPKPPQQHILGTVGGGRDLNTVGDPQQQPILNGTTNSSDAGGGTLKLIVNMNGTLQFWNFTAAFDSNA